MTATQWRRTLGDLFVAGTGIATIVTNLPDQIIDFHRIHSRSPYSLPNWRFFGPTPGTVNVYLYARGSDGGAWTEWWSVVPDGGRTRFPLLGNPGNRCEKVLIDLANMFNAMALVTGGGVAEIAASDPYRRLLKIGRSLSFPAGVEQGQVMLVEVRPEAEGGFGDPVPIVVTDPFTVG
ncbi:hypothetical protein ACTXOY_13515 [Corynebacterium variabile]|uniref:hypothetical protein n=1 Tax=Corynebacterium variabile TaxID=1727 RepID=UPI003FD38782